MEEVMNSVASNVGTNYKKLHKAVAYMYKKNEFYIKDIRYVSEYICMQ